MIALRPFHPGDLAALAARPGRLTSWAELEGWDLASPELGDALANAGPAWTAHVGETLLGVAGFWLVHPHYAKAWAVLGPDAPAHAVSLSRRAAARIHTAPYDRLEAQCRADSPKASRWAGLLGLPATHRLRRAGPNHEDYVLHERVR